jgi:hypothetical protein
LHEFFSNGVVTVKDFSKDYESLWTKNEEGQRVLHWGKEYQ